MTKFLKSDAEQERQPNTSPPICHYIGIDSSTNMIQKHLNIFSNPVSAMEASDLHYPSNSFNKVFAFSVFHYFPDRAYFDQALAEAIRIAQCG